MACPLSACTDDGLGLPLPTCQHTRRTTICIQVAALHAIVPVHNELGVPLI